MSDPRLTPPSKCFRSRLDLVHASVGKEKGERRKAYYGHTAVDSLDDGHQHIQRRRRVIQLSPAMIGYKDGVRTVFYRQQGIFLGENTLQPDG